MTNKTPAIIALIVSIFVLAILTIFSSQHTNSMKNESRSIQEIQDLKYELAYMQKKNKSSMDSSSIMILDKKIYQLENLVERIEYKSYRHNKTLTYSLVVITLLSLLLSLFMYKKYRESRLEIIEIAKSNLLPLNKNILKELRNIEEMIYYLEDHRLDKSEKKIMLEALPTIKNLEEKLYQARRIELHNLLSILRNEFHSSLLNQEDNESNYIRLRELFMRLRELTDIEMKTASNNI